MTNGLVIKDVSHSYGAKKALSNVNFSVERGTFCALLGPNGAGKSTLFSLLTRLLSAQSGAIEIAGHDVAKQPLKALSKLGIVFQQPTLDLDLTVQQNLTYFAGLHGLSGRVAKEQISRSLAQLDMAERSRETVRSLNGGHRRRMEIARALVHKPEVLLLDEPTVGLDAATRSLLTAHVHDLAAEEGLCVLWATHLVDEVRPDDQLVILNKGEVIQNSVCRDVVGQQTLTDTFAALTEEVA